MRHKIAEYKVKANYVLCTCDWKGLPEEYNDHLLKDAKSRNRNGSLKLLDEIKYARMDYYNQSCGSPYRIRDEEFM